MFKRTIALSAVLAASAAACSSSSGSAATGNSSPAGGECKVYKVCSMVSASQVSSAFGATFAAGTESDPNETPSDSEAELVSCDFAGPDHADATVMVRCCPCNDNMPATVEAEARLLSVVTDVTGIGDSAFWQAPITDAGGLVIDAYTLDVFKGADIYVTVSINNPPANMDPLEGAKSIAASVLSQL